MKPIAKKGEVKVLKKVEPSEKDIEEIDTEESLLDKVEAELAKDAVIMFTNENIDREYMVLPIHLDEVSPTDIGRYLHTITQQRVWVRTLLARVGVLMREANEKLDKEKARIYADKPAKMSVTEKELALYEDVKALVILEQIKNISAKYDMLDAYMKNLEDIIFDVSREISRRGMDSCAFGRVENVGGKRR